MIPLSRRFRGNKRKLIIAGGIVGVLFILSGYIVWGNSSWANYHAAYGEWKADTKGKIDAALKLPATNTKERTAKLQAFATVSDTIAARDRSLCKVNSMINWQQSFIATYKKWQQECEATQASVDSLNEKLVTATKFLKNERALADALSAALAATSKKITEGSFSAVLTKWNTAVGAVKGLDTLAEFTPVKAKAQKAVGDVAAAWQSLIVAHTAKDETKYEKALATLTSAYSKLDSIEKESTKQFAEVSGAVQSGYESAF